MPENSISVKQLNFYVKTLLEGDVRLGNISVTGEISNLKLHYSSGHWYFTLKDSDASVRCVMFRAAASRVCFVPQDGMAVVVTGRVSLYEKDGQYQFYAEEMHASGEGDLAAAFRQIKEKLEKEGLFDDENKRPLKKFPRKIAVITSESGAAVRDILNILARRYPVCDVVMCPVTVQGDTAVASMINALERVYSLDGIDTVIIGRGGGSAEDLWAFNSEELARKIYESPFPVISAVGHETDFTICDFVSDVRASTPSAAAELAVPDINDILFTVFSLNKRLQMAVKSKFELCTARLNAAVAVASSARAQDVINRKEQAVDKLYDALINSANNKLNQNTARFEKAAAKLDSLSPLKTLSRGFAVVQKNGKAISSVNDLQKGDKIDLKLADGSLECIVKTVAERNDI